MERLHPNGTAEQLAANDVYGVFSTLFRDSYYLADIGEVNDSRLQEITDLFGARFAVSPEQLINKIGDEYLPSLRDARFSCQMSNDVAAFETTLLRSTAAGEQVIFTSIDSMTGSSTYRLTSPVDSFSSKVIPRLSSVLNDPENRHRHNWRKGDFLVIDNLRLMHGREAFNGGERVLRHIRIA